MESRPTVPLAKVDIIMSIFDQLSQVGASGISRNRPRPAAPRGTEAIGPEVAVRFNMEDMATITSLWKFD